MLVNFSDDATQLKRVRALSAEALRDLGVAGNARTQAIVEILLEVCDDNLEVLISEAELRMLADLYVHLQRAQPFGGLRRLIDLDVGAELFFADLRELVTIEDVQQRGEAWLEVFKDFAKYVQRQIFSLSPWAATIHAWGQDYLSFHRQYRMMLSRKQSGPTWRN